MCGWWDPYAQTTTDNYLGIARREQHYVNVCTVHTIMDDWGGVINSGPVAINALVAADLLNDLS